MSPVLVDFSHTLPEGLLSLSRGGTTDGMGSLEGATLRPRPSFAVRLNRCTCGWGVFDLADRCKLKPERWKRTIKEREVNFGCRFDEEFKRDAVRMLESGVRAMGQLSQELGVSVWSLGRWSKLYGKDSAAGGTSGAGGVYFPRENGHRVSVLFSV